MADDGTFPAQINPLAFIEAEEVIAGRSTSPPTSDALLQFLCQPDVDMDRVVDRYREIDGGQSKLWIAPAEPRVLDKLIWPLRHAKAAYLVGNYLSVIALTGMVAEMVALLRWQLADVTINGDPMTEEREANLFGSSFEKLGQERRQRVLRVYGIVDEDADKRFTDIRTRRRKYLHLWSQDHDQLPADSRACYDAAVGLVVSVLGQEVRGSGVALDPALKRYLSRHGFYEPKGQSPSG